MQKLGFGFVLQCIKAVQTTDRKLKKWGDGDGWKKLEIIQ